jgi:hypothetical protein
MGGSLPCQNETALIRAIRVPKQAFGWTLENHDMLIAILARKLALC